MNEYRAARQRKRDERRRKTAEVATAYGLKEVAPGVYEKSGDEDEQHFKGVPRIELRRVEIDDAGWKYECRYADGVSVDRDHGEDPDGLEYYLNPGTMQDEGHEPEDA